MRHYNHLDFRDPSELDNPDNRVLLAFFFIFPEMWVAELFARTFRRGQDQGREFTERQPHAMRRFEIFGMHNGRRACRERRMPHS